MKKLTNSKRMEAILDELRDYWRIEDPRQTHGLTESQVTLLLSLSERTGCRVQDMAERLDLTAPTISIGVRRLESMGLVERKADNKDRRAVCLYLSPQGRKIASRAKAYHTAKLEELLGTLSEGEQETMLALLERALTSKH